MQRLPVLVAFVLAGCHHQSAAPVAHSPVVEADGSVTFVYVGTGREHDVRLVGDFTPRSAWNVYWHPRGLLMDRVGGDGRLFMRKMRFEPDARLDYRFIVDGRPTLDSLNPRQIFSGAGEGMASELVMPAFRPAPEAVIRPAVRPGRLQVLDEPWADPRVTIYLPPGYPQDAPYAVIYAADGSAWRDFVKLPNILDNLIASREIAPVIAVMIDAARDRRAWYGWNPAYLAYLERVVAAVDTRFATRRIAADRVHIGSSAGARAALQGALERPALFGGAGLFSPALRMAGTRVPYERLLAGTPTLRVWLSAGTYEPTIHTDALELERHLATFGLPVRSAYTHEGHSFGAWQHLAPDMLRHFFGAPAARVEP